MEIDRGSVKRTHDAADLYELYDQEIPIAPKKTSLFSPHEQDVLIRIKQFCISIDNTGDPLIYRNNEGFLQTSNYVFETLNSYLTDITLIQKKHLNDPDLQQLIHALNGFHGIGYKFLQFS